MKTDIHTFETDDKIIEYLSIRINEINVVQECRLSRSEQLNISDEVIHFRNCIEWLIRANRTIKNIKYALEKSLGYSTKMISPITEDENQTSYSYYLEDAVYRNLVLWDVFRQLLNEYYKCGVPRNDKISIYKFMREYKDKLGADKSEELLAYLSSEEHKKVRETLRNSFTHSLEATNSYIFHREIDGKLKPDMDNLFPEHPFANLNYVIDDSIKLIAYINEVSLIMLEYRKQMLVAIKITLSLPCGKIDEDSDVWNLKPLLENYEKLLYPCENPCEKAHEYEQRLICKPEKICYQSCEHSSFDISGELVPVFNFDEIKKQFPC